MSRAYGRRIRRHAGAIGLACLLVVGCGDRHKDGNNNTDAGPHPDGWVDPDATTDGGGSDATTPVIPHITSVEPSGIPCTQDTQVTVFGVLMPTDATVILVNCDTGEVLEVQDVQTASATQYSFTLPAQADCADLQGLYRVELTGTDESLASPCGIYLSAFDPPLVTDVTPPYAFAGDPGDGLLSDRLVTITGVGFRSTPSVKLVNADTPSLQFESTAVSYINDQTLTAVVPSESRQMPPGDYWVYVQNPDLLQGQWLVDTNNDGLGDEPGLFAIMSVPPPIIDYLNPARPTSNACPLTLEIIGSGFVTGSEAFILVPTGTNCPTGTTQTAPGECLLNATCADAANPAVCSGTRIAVNLASCPAKGFYPVRVRNPDGQSGDFYFLVITESATAHLNEAFVTVPQPLGVGRQRAGGVTGFDAVGGSHIYVVGGQDGARAVLGGGERAAVSVYGELGPWQPLVQYQGSSPADLRRPNVLMTPRHGHVLLRAGRHLYAIGGAAADTFLAPEGGVVNALDSVEVARILGSEKVPLVAHPSWESGLGLPPGSWYYSVSAILTEDGETLPSTEVSISNIQGVLRVCWTPVQGATAYNIYRCRAADGRAGTGRLLAAGEAGTVQGALRCFTDDGHGTLLPAPGFLRASLQTGGSLALGEHTYVVTATHNGRETLGSYPLAVAVSDPAKASLRLRWNVPSSDPAVISGITYSVYRTPAPGQGAAAAVLLVNGLTTAEYLDTGAVTPAGASPGDGVAPLPPGTLSRWKIARDVNGDPVLLTVPREGADGVAIKVVDGDNATQDDPSFLYVVGGRSSNDIRLPSVYLKSVERVRVYTDGTLGAGGFDLEPYDLSTARAFYALLTNAPAETSPPPPDLPDCAIPDADGDGYIRCDCGGDDCDDTDPEVHPGAEEICGDGIDQDCDQGCNPGSDLECPECLPEEWDLDGDGHMAPPCGDDCDDTNPNIYEGAPEAFCDGVDQDCDGADFCIPPGPPPQSLPWDGIGATLAVSWAPVTSQLSPAAPLWVGQTPAMPPHLAPPPPEPTHPLYLMAAQGDESYNSWPGSTSGLAHFEVCRIDNTGSWDPAAVNYNPNYGGLLDCDGGGTADTWALQLPTSTRSMPGGIHGQRAALYEGAVYVLGGASSETVPTSVSPTSGGNRFEFWDTGDPLANPSTLLSNRQNIGGGGFGTARAYFMMVRINGKHFIIGGTSTGLDALATVESVSQ